VNSTELLEYWRRQIVDVARPHLWSDDEAFTYMNEAQNQLCRKTEGIPDGLTPEVVFIPVVTGEIAAPVHKKILNFRTAALVSTGQPVDVINHTLIYNWKAQQGSVTQMLVGLEKNKVRWNYTPTVDDEVHVLVFRLPLCAVTDFDQALEVEDTHHPSLTYWMTHLACLKHDTETFDKQASDRAKALFEEYCLQVKFEQERYKQRVRVVAYGGI
jgi:hypothetical protein